MKAVKAESISDLNCELDTRNRRPIKKKRFSDFNTRSYTDSGETSSACDEEDILPMPSLHQNSFLSNTVLPREPKSSSLLSTLGLKKVSEVLKSSNYSPSSSTDTPTLKANVLHKGDCSNISDDAFKKQVLRQFAVLNCKLEQLSEDLHTLYPNKKEDPQEKASLLSMFKAPIDSAEDLIPLEEYLMEEENMSEFVAELARTGGATYKIMIRRLMTKLLSNKLAMQYSWIGFKKKKNFSVLRIARAIIDAVKKSHSNTEADIENSIKIWLAKAKEREVKGGGTN